MARTFGATVDACRTIRFSKVQRQICRAKPGIRQDIREGRLGTDNTRYRSAGGAICRLIRVIRWFNDFSLMCLTQRHYTTSNRLLFRSGLLAVAAVD